jgi:MFS transporter, DHA2 family, multidrug resistance protein
VGLDVMVLSVALSTLSRALHASESDLQWISPGYLLVLAAAMLPAGLLGDRYGHKKVMLVSLGLFGAGSAACAYPPPTSAAEFLAARLGAGDVRTCMRTWRSEGASSLTGRRRRRAHP